MARAIAPKPPKGPIEIAIDNAIGDGKRMVRFNAAFQAAQDITSFSRGDMVITVIAGPERVGAIGMRFQVTAAKAGITQDIDQWREIHNPPNKVSANTWHLEDGEEVENFREASQEAVESVLLDSVIEHPR